MSFHTYKPVQSFVPNYILANLSRAGVEEARLSIHQSSHSREARRSNAKETNVGDIITFAQSTRSMGAVAVKVAAARKIYDCEGKWKLRTKLVREEGDSAASDECVNQVYDFASVVREYYKNILNRDSIDNLGMDLIFNVHYGQDFMNAFWDGDEMIFGDGDGKVFVNFSSSLEVIAHELAHGVTQHTANLEYMGQSGALNEHFSDVFGSAIQQHAQGQTADNADWLIGNEIMGPELYGEALRSMKEPGTAFDNKLMGKDQQPAHMRDYYAGPEDNQGVHMNSGIMNKAFYLTAMEIGTDTAALIWYHALEKLWPTAKFNDAVSVIAESARLLTRDQKVPAGTTQNVRAAFKEVGLPQL
ncbi:M4 family metallopeptidase [Aneurinibacillus tyrosinisolvens]|uniref:M4 family metallopeptidase n=1 Tax=Aneurinibacillus tyrosinisolvens TaxID=1443435 RepID=UPI00063F449B|nr:M4 family metallopeptidase [Aneurinibacillus tyrosinisolvens]